MTTVEALRFLADSHQLRIVARSYHDRVPLLAHLVCRKQVLLDLHGASQLLNLQLRHFASECEILPGVEILEVVKDELLIVPRSVLRSVR